MFNPESNMADVTDAEAAPARAEENAEIIASHLDWLRTYARTMTASNWADMRLYIERQVGWLEAALTSDDAKDRRIAEIEADRYRVRRALSELVGRHANFCAYAGQPTEAYRAFVTGAQDLWDNARIALGNDSTGAAERVNTLTERLEAAEAQLRLSSGTDDGVRGLAQLRADGWSVAVHNDYRLAGVQMTFWLFAHSGGQWVKGEGRSDGEAIAAALEQITRRT